MTADPLVGREFGGYRIEALLGAGGMGAVYRATQLSLRRPVALKVLPETVGADPQFVHRFHREAEVLGSLSHPNIVQVIDRGACDGRYFIAMEYVDGENLRTIMRRGPMAAREACRVVRGLLDALDCAHRRGVVHRDIKPENVLVSSDGVVKVADFGLSRVFGGDGEESRLTRTQMLLGTFEYMAPEQRERAKEADARSDLYATAVVLYEMLTGELPIGRFAMPSERLPGLDSRLDAILHRGLAKDPDGRYGRASEMGRAIASLSALAAPEPPPEWPLWRGAAAEVKRLVVGLRPRVASRLDLLLTLLAVAGMLMSVVGVVLLLAHEEFEVGLYDIDRDAAGVVVLLYGMLLWNGAERARHQAAGARRMLLALTALALPTLVAIPLTVWTWAVLLDRRVRVRFEHAVAPAEALTVASEPPQEGPSPADRLRAAARLNRHVGKILLVLAGIGVLAWTIEFLDSARSALRDDWFALLAVAGGLALLALLLRRLGTRVREGRLLRLNALLWTLVGPIAPRAARRAREVAREHRALTGPAATA